MRVSAPIYIISDCADVAEAEMRAAVRVSASSRDADVFVGIEPLTRVRDFSVVNASFLLRLLGEVVPEGSILMVIVNSIDRRTERLIGRTRSRNVFFEGTNTGALGWLVDDLGVAECYELTDPGFVPFGGKYVHAPAVGQLAAGCPLSDLGDAFPPAGIRREPLRPWSVVHIDNFGNAKMFSQSGDLPGVGTPVAIGLPSGDTLQATVGARMMDFESGVWVIYPGSSLGLVEIGQVRSAGFLRHALAPGEILSVSW